MSYEIDLAIATSRQIEAALCARLVNIRLARNITQAHLAKQAGVSLRTIGRMEKGEGVSLDTFIRVMTALGIQQNLEVLLPDPSIRPIERAGALKKERRRARPRQPKKRKDAWSWGDEENDQ